MKLSEVVSELSEREYLVIDKKVNVAVVFDRIANTVHGEERTKRMYILKDAENVEPVDLNGAIRELVKTIEGKVKIKTFLSEVIKTSSPEDILEAIKRIKDEKLKAKMKMRKDGCVYISIPGKKGQRPVDIYLRKA